MATTITQSIHDVKSVELKPVSEKQVTPTRGCVFYSRYIIIHTKETDLQICLFADNKKDLQTK